MTDTDDAEPAMAEHRGPGHRRRLERRLEGLGGVLPGESMFGHGTAYWANGTEIVHFDGDAVVDIRLTRSVIRELRSDLTTDPRVTLRRSGADWLSVRVERTADLDLVLDLAARAARAHQPPPGAPVKPPPPGADLERRRRFH